MAFRAGAAMRTRVYSKTSLITVSATEEFKCPNLHVVIDAHVTFGKENLDDFGYCYAF